MTKTVTADDPEPKGCPFPLTHDADLTPENKTDEQLNADFDAWKAWYDRNTERIDAANAPIRARYPHKLERLLKLAEKNMVEHAALQFKVKFPDRFDSVSLAFTAYRDGDLYGEKLERFLTLCFNCPE